MMTQGMRKELRRCPFFFFASFNLFRVRLREKKRGGFRGWVHLVEKIKGKEKKKKKR